MNAQLAFLPDDVGQPLAHDAIDLPRLAATWKAVEAISGEFVRRSYLASGITMATQGGATTVRYRGVSVAVMPARFNRRDLFRSMIDWLHAQGARVFEILGSAWVPALPFPPGHVLLMDATSELRWVKSIRSNSVSVFVKPRQGLPAGAVEMNAEFRVFLDHPRAILFMDCNLPSQEPWPGPQPPRSDLMAGRDRCIVSVTYEDLAAELHRRYMGGLAVMASLPAQVIGDGLE